MKRGDNWYCAHNLMKQGNELFPYFTKLCAWDNKFPCFTKLCAKDELSHAHNLVKRGNELVNHGRDIYIFLSTRHMKVWGSVQKHTKTLTKIEMKI